MQDIFFKTVLLQPLCKSFCLLEDYDLIGYKYTVRVILNVIYFYLVTTKIFDGVELLAVPLDISISVALRHLENLFILSFFIYPLFSPGPLMSLLPPTGLN